MSNAGDKEVREASLVIYAKLITLDPKKNKIETIFPEKLNEQKLKKVEAYVKKLEAGIDISMFENGAETSALGLARSQSLKAIPISSNP
jgi:hypothetical protein